MLESIIKGQELETKILGVDHEKLKEKLLEIGAQYEGAIEIREQRYKRNKTMEDTNRSMRLRMTRLLDENDEPEEGGGRVEWMIKEQLPNLSVNGHEAIKNRIEKDRIFTPQEGETVEEIYEGLRTDFRMMGMKDRDCFVTHRHTYALEHMQGTRCDLDSIVCYVDDKGRTPSVPPFLEIEGSGTEVILSVAKLLGFSLKDLSPLSKRELMKKYSSNIKKQK